MQSIDKFQSELKMNCLVFKRICFDLHDEKHLNPENLQMAFNRDIVRKEDGSYDVVLSLDFCSSPGSAHSIIDIKVVGNFSLMSDDEEFVKDVMTNNATAILFPYIRSQLTLLTSQPGCMPIILPPFNINSFIENNRREG